MQVLVLTWQLIMPRAAVCLAMLTAAVAVLLLMWKSSRECVVQAEPRDHPPQRHRPHPSRPRRRPSRWLAWAAAVVQQQLVLTTLKLPTCTVHEIHAS